MSHKKLLSKIILFSILSAIAIDIATSMLIGGFDYQPTRHKLKNYFSYGVSTFRKLKAHVGLDGSEQHSIAVAGWNEAQPDRLDAVNTDCTTKLTFYGMSFSNRISEQLAAINPCMSIRQIAGPGAPLSHSYYMATRFAAKDDSQFAVLGILASSLPKVTTMAHFNSAFEFPGAHMYPRYSVTQDNMLTAVMPPAETLSEFKHILSDNHRLNALKDLLSKHDAYFSELVFAYSWLDYSNIAKMLRRSYAQKNKRDVVSKLYSKNRFNDHLGLRETSRKLVSEFAELAQRHKQTPIVLLINDKGYDGALDELLLGLLDDKGIPYITSTAFIDSADLSNFLEDGHFTSENDKRLAKAIEELVAKDEKRE